MRNRQAILRYLRRKFTKQVDQRIVAYLVCVLIALTLWFLNALNKEYVTEISYPVRYTNIPESYYLSDNLPEEIVLNVTAKGFNLLGHRMQTSFQPIELNIAAYSDVFIENGTGKEYTLYTSTIRDRIAGQMNTDIKLNRVMPESLNFKLSKAKSKRVPVEANIEYMLKPQYTLAEEPIVIPDSILITGPRDVVDSVQMVQTQYITLGLLGERYSSRLALEKIPDVRFSTDKVDVVLNVEQFTELQLSVPIVATNVPDSLYMRLLPSFVTVTCNVGLSHFDSLTPKRFAFAVDFNQTENSGYLDVVLTEKPRFVFNLTYFPTKVEYIIEKRK
ncbi:MAG: CdaR family protein [Marinifilaceae bacterium]